MIRQDYFMRMVQELVEALLRAGFLKRRQEYAAALETIDAILAKLRGDQPDELAFEQLLSLCAEAGDSATEQLTVVADLLFERGDLLLLQARSAEAVPSLALSLGLHLEAMQSRHVTMDQVNKVERLISLTPTSALSAPIMHRLLTYFEARSRFARAEDLLFEWLARERTNAAAAALAFYDRLAAKTDAELEAGDLPRAEVEEGRRAIESAQPKA